jgi:hypothetical protein
VIAPIEFRQYATNNGPTTISVLMLGFCFRVNGTASAGKAKKANHVTDSAIGANAWESAEVNA